MIRFGRRSGIYPEFSNFWNCRIKWNGLVYSNAEAVFQAQKPLIEEEQLKFVNLNGGQAKQLGRKITLRSDWESIKFQTMCDIVYAKFSQNEKLKELLLNTGTEYIMEDTTGWQDNIWGHCSCDRCKSKPSKNLLGLALMFTRAKLIGDDKCEVIIKFGDEVFTPDLYTLMRDDGERFWELIDNINKYAE